MAMSLFRRSGKIRSLPLLAAGLIVFLTFGVWLCAWMTAIIMTGAQSRSLIGSAYLLQAGADKIMRRCLMGMALIAVYWFVRRSGWQGKHDCGWADQEDSGRLWWGSALQGLALGVVSLGGIAVITTILDIHGIPSGQNAARIIRTAVMAFLTGLTVALIEETVMRGVLFRVLARNWRIWPAAVLSSLCFALAHYVGPAPDAFHGASLPAAAWNLFVSTFLNTAGQTAGHLLRFVNLALMGLVMCAFVIRTKTIWLAVGAHAGWVWMIKLHSAITQFNPAAPIPFWLGKRNDFTDSLLAVLVLALLAVGAMWRCARRQSALRHGGMLWRFDQADAGRLADWLDRYGQAGAVREGRVLKAYPGCKVIACGGLVLKVRRPVGLGQIVRFALRPSRACRAFRLAGAFAKSELQTPHAVACAIERRWGIKRADCMLSVEIQNVQPLAEALKQAEPGLRCRILGAYGKLMADFHCAGYSNRDLKHENVLCLMEEPWRVWVVDLDGARHKVWLTRRRTRRDLRRVGLSLRSLGLNQPEDTAAFFAAYNAVVPPRLRRASFRLE